jgi:hypothetical protein
MLARDGKTVYSIIQAENATGPEKFAVQELANFLGRVTGASFPVTSESALSEKTRAIYVGWTDYAARQGVDAAKLGEEEWIIRRVGKDLVLAGGRPRGTLYAVYEFLERQVGCHWLAEDTEVIPSRPVLALGKMDIQGKPCFWQRALSSHSVSSNARWLFLIRNKTYRYDFLGNTNFFPAGAFYPLNGSPRVGHSFSYFVNASNWFESHPEYFSLDATGKRLPAYDGAGPGQLCLTHPDVRRLTKEKLREFIAKDRKLAAGGYVSRYQTISNAVPPPRVYTIGQNDKYDTHCKCTNCQAIARREGSESGPLIDFINDIAGDIEKDYPDILIETFAYNLTSPPPKTIKPRHNVLIGWCDVYTVCDLVFPVTHPYNSRNYKEITGWAAVAPRISISDDYWILFGYYENFPAPYCMIQCLGPDLKLFADCHAESFYSETYDYLEAGENFTVLKLWLAYQLLVNPYQPAEPLIKIFMDGYYGVASSKMKEYLDYLQGRIAKEAEFLMTRAAPHNLKYLDLNFFLTAGKIFDEAEALVKPGSRESMHIKRERFIVDGALLHLWPWLDRKLAANEKMPFDHEKVIRQWETNGLAYTKLQYSRVYSEKGVIARMAALFRDPKIPEQLRNLPPREAADFNWLTFSPVGQKIVDDKDAAGGMAAKFTPVQDAIRAAEKQPQLPAGGDDALKKPLTFGVTGGQTVTLKAEEIPQDGKYHLFKIGLVNVRKDTTVWAMDGKRLRVNVDRLFVTNSADSAANDWNAYISLKVQGPAFVTGSAETNGVWMDRVLLVRPQPGEKEDPAEQQRREQKKKMEARRPQADVPRLAATAAGDINKVDWDKAARCGEWSTLDGLSVARKLEARLAHDGQYFYLRLVEEMNAKTLINAPDVFSGDDWELIFAARRGEQPYRQIGINPSGEHVDLAYGESSRQWDSGVKVASDTAGNQWKVSLCFPLDRLLPGGVKPGQTVYVNILRGGKAPLAWSPTFESSFHVLDCLGVIVLK